MFRKKKKKLETKAIREIERIKIETNEFTGGTSIQIIFSNGEVNNLWLNSVDSRLKLYSESQIKRIWSETKIFLETMNPNDIPVVYHEIVRELEEAAKNRGVDI